VIFCDWRGVPPVRFGSNPIVASWYLGHPVGFPDGAQAGDSVGIDMFRATWVADLPEPLLPIVTGGRVVVGVVEGAGQIRFDPAELTRSR